MKMKVSIQCFTQSVFFENWISIP